MTMPDGCFARMEPKEPGAEPCLYRVTLGPGAIEPRATVGSGDAFLAGFVAAHYLGRPQEECLAYGVAFGAEAVPILDHLLDHPELHTRNAAASTLAQIHDQKARQALQRRLPEEKEPLVRKTIESGLRPAP
jgi:hypothetical protein